MIKVCVVVASRANYGRVKYVLKAMQADPGVELQLVVGASTLLDRFGSAIDVIEADGFQVDRSIHYVVEGETLLTQAKSTGLGVIEMATTFDSLMPDFVLTVADRFETMATAIAATYMNIPLIHLQGGEISGNIDDRVRHAITKLADYHFVATESSRERVIRMGEAPSRTFFVGCPAMDVIANLDLSINNDLMSRYGGTGPEVDWEKPYILMVQHPVTTSYGKGFLQVSETLNALLQMSDYQKVVLWPNADAGSDDVSKGIRVFRECHFHENFHFYKNFSPEDYVRVMKNASCVVGNSSSFLREGAFMGVPAVLVGDRQKNREHGNNVVFVDYHEMAIKDAVVAQIEHGAFVCENIFGEGDAGERICRKIYQLNHNSLNKPVMY